MNYKLLGILVVLLVVGLTVQPVASMWNNGNWVSDDKNNGCDSTSFDAQTGVTSCYKAQSAEVEFRNSPSSMQGILRGNIRCGYNLLTTEVGIRNDANPDGDKGEFKFFPILPDGRFGDTNGNPDINLIPGSFTLMVKDGNGGQPEYSHARISAGGISYPEREILGHAISAVGKHTTEYVILKASYCGETIPAVTHVEHHDAYYTITKAEWIGGWFGHYNGNAIKSLCDPYDFIVDDQKYDFQYHGRWIYTFHQAYDETIIDTPEVLGGCADVTSKVKGVVASGHLSFLFNNAENPGGIFNVMTTTLLSQINDPAPGIPKHVSISYTRDGAPMTIDTMEYTPITL